MLRGYTNTDEATARRALNGVHAAAIHKLSLSLSLFWSSLNAAAAAAACLSFSVIDARRKLVERG